MGLICFFNWYYTFLQLEPKELAEQLKRQVRSSTDIHPQGLLSTPCSLLDYPSIIITFFSPTSTVCTAFELV